MVEQAVISWPLQHHAMVSCTHSSTPQRLLQPETREREGEERGMEIEEEGGKEKNDFSNDLSASWTNL